MSSFISNSQDRHELQRSFWQLCFVSFVCIQYSALRRLSGCGVCRVGNLVKLIALDHCFAEQYMKTPYRVLIDSYGSQAFRRGLARFCWSCQVGERLQVISSSFGHSFGPTTCFPNQYSRLKVESNQSNTVQNSTSS